MGDSTRMFRGNVAAGAAFLLALIPKTSAQSVRQHLSPPPLTPNSTQKILNVLSTPVSPSKLIAGLPDSYNQWTEEQKKTVPQQMEQRCRVLWTMMNDSGPVRLLPPA